MEIKKGYAIMSAYPGASKAIKVLKSGETNLDYDWRTIKNEKHIAIIREQPRT